MFKLSKTMHMMILMTFTIVFVVVYMYYMIRDVRKMYEEVKKQGQEIETIKKSYSELQTNINTLANTLNTPPPMMPADAAMFMATQFGGGPNGNNGMMHFNIQEMMQQEVQDIQSVQGVQGVQGFQGEEAQKQQETADDEIESVVTEDIKKLIEDEDKEEIKENDIEQEILNDIENHDSKKTLYELDALKKMKIDEIKDICKSLGIVTKGTRDTLISKIMEMQK